MRTSLIFFPRIELKVVSKLFSKLAESTPRDASEYRPMPFPVDVFSECEYLTVSAWFDVICQSIRGSKDLRVAGRVTVCANGVAWRFASRIVAVIVEFSSE